MFVSEVIPLYCSYLILCQFGELCISGDSTANCGGITHGSAPSVLFNFFSYPHFCHLYISSFYVVLNLFFFFIKAGLGLPDTDAWYMIETIAEKNSIGYKQFVSYCFYPIFSFGVVDYFWILMSLIYGGIPIPFFLSLSVFVMRYFMGARCLYVLGISCIACYYYLRCS